MVIEVISSRGLTYQEARVFDAVELKVKDTKDNETDIVLFEDNITNLPGGSRHNIEPGMKMKIIGKKAEIISSAKN